MGKQLMELDGRKAYVLRCATHTIEEVKPKDGSHFTNEEINELIGGWYECVAVVHNDDYLMYVDENGILKHRPENGEASILAGQLIVGDVLIKPKKQHHKSNEEESTD